MKTVNCGGLKMPIVGLGTWQAIDEKELETTLETALTAGYRHIDTAFFYQNEHLIGKVLKKWIAAGKLKREDVFITTKLPVTGIHPDRVEMFMKKSLENLQLDYVDLYLIHFSIGLKYKDDPLKIPEEPEYETPTDHLGVWKKMEEQVDAGRTKSIGLSNFNIKQIDKILKASRIKPACLQVELNVYLQQRELVDYCHKNNIAVVAYAPLGSPGFNNFATFVGAPTRKLPDMLNDQTIITIAKKHNKTNAQVLLRFLIQKNIVVIPKSVSPKRIKENIDLFNFSLDKDDMRKLDQLEVGEDARIFTLENILKGVENHPDYPYRK